MPTLSGIDNTNFLVTLTGVPPTLAANTWALTSGSLPNGLTLNTATGVISGTPSKAGTYSFMVKVTDSF